MISAIFIHRPRLAIVIAIVITIAGAIALTRIPVAQFPDIVPPRVQVTASAGVDDLASLTRRCSALLSLPTTNR